MAVDVRISTWLIAVRDTVVASLFGLPIVLLVGVMAIGNIAEPFPGVSPLHPLVGWNVPGDSVGDPQALDILEDVRRSVERPVWLRETAQGLQILTPGGGDAMSAMRPALASHDVDTTRFSLYAGAYSFALVDLIESFRAEPGAVASALRNYVPALVLSAGLGFLVAGWWFRRKRPVAGWDAEPAARPPLFRQALLGVGVGVASLAVVIPVTMLVETIFGLETLEQPIVTALIEDRGIALAAFVLLAVVVAPAGEELFFRGHLFRWSASRCGVAYAYVLTAILFSAIHGNAPGIPAYVIFAVVLAWAYERWRVLLVPIIAHATVNGVQIGYVLLG